MVTSRAYSEVLDCDFPPMDEIQQAMDTVHEYKMTQIGIHTVAFLMGWAHAKGYDVQPVKVTRLWDLTITLPPKPSSSVDATPATGFQEPRRLFRLDRDEE